jgi:hypothetical protein
MVKTFTIRTDDNGYYHSTQSFSPPGPFGFHVELYATLTSPQGLTVKATVELDSRGGAPQSKQFVANTGVKISLGSWYIAHGNSTHH